MDKVEALRVFVAVASHGSFVAASRALGLSAPAVTRAIARLENELGAVLLHRTTRAVRLSDRGQSYLTDAKSILEAIEAADAAVSGSYGTPKGTLRLTAPVRFGERYVMPIVADYLQRHDAVTVECLLLDRVTHLLEDNLDIAIRLGELRDSGLYSKTVGSIRKVTCASPAYLARHGRPESPRELRTHKIVQATAVEPTTVWSYGSDRVRVSPTLLCNQNGAAVRATECAAGISRLMSYQVADALHSGTLELVLERYAPPPLPVNLVYLEGRHSSAAIRAFLDLAAERLEADLMEPTH